MIHITLTVDDGADPARPGRTLIEHIDVTLDEDDIHTCDCGRRYYRRLDVSGPPPMCTACIGKHYRNPPIRYDAFYAGTVQIDRRRRS